MKLYELMQAVAEGQCKKVELFNATHPMKPFGTFDNKHFYGDADDCVSQNVFYDYDVVRVTPSAANVLAIDLAEPERAKDTGCSGCPYCEYECDELGWHGHWNCTYSQGECYQDNLSYADEDRPEESECSEGYDGYIEDYLADQPPCNYN